MASRLRSHGVLVLVVVLLSAASTALVGGVVNGFGRSTTAVASCEPPHAASQVVQVGLYDGGNGMMGAAPMMLRLIPSPFTVWSGVALRRFASMHV